MVEFISVKSYSKTWSEKNYIAYFICIVCGSADLYIRDYDRGTLLITNIITSQPFDVILN